MAETTAPPPPPPLSQVIPVLVAALVCDVAVKEPATGKSNLIGIFDKVFVLQFPAARPMTVYLKLTDAEGRYEIAVRYVHLESGTAYVEARGEMLVDNRLASMDAHFDFGTLPLPQRGRYEFQVLVNGVYVGSTFIDAIQRPAGPQPS